MCKKHACYDGTISLSYELFVVLSLIEQPEPNWNEMPRNGITLEEKKFDLDNYIIDEIKRVRPQVEQTVKYFFFNELYRIYIFSVNFQVIFFCILKQKHSIIVSAEQYDVYGKKFMKTYQLHPDSYIQMVIQLTYYKLHNE